MSSKHTPEWTDDAGRLLMRSMFNVFGKLRELHAEMPVQQIMVLHYIALHEGCTQREVSRDLDMPPSSSSRNIAALSSVHRLGKEGLGLVTWVDDPLDRRAKILMLTERGRTLMRRLIETIA